MFAPTKQRNFIQMLLAGALMLMLQPLMAADIDYTGELTRALLFSEPLVWVGQTPPSEAESKELWQAAGLDPAYTGGDKFSNLETFVQAHPKSPWTPSLEANLANYYCQNGYFTPALENWQAAWEATKQSSDWKEQLVADNALAHWLHLLSSLGRTDTMKTLFDETKDRQIVPLFHPLYQQSHAAYNIMLKHPEISYRCGTYAMSAVAGVLGATNYFHSIWQQPSPPTGFSMSDLIRLSDANHLNLVAVQRTQGNELVTPSVVHWKQNHYAAIIARRGNLYQVVDPTFQMTRWLSADAINAECSGQFLVSASQVPPGWRQLSESEASQIFGKGYPGFWRALCNCPDGTCPGCGPGTGGAGGSGGLGGLGGPPCSTCSANSPPISVSSPPISVSMASDGGNGYGGMPDWTVTEPGCDLWLRDEPLAYQPSKGPRISFKLFDTQEVQNNEASSDIAGASDIISMVLNGNLFTFGHNWYPSWLSAVVPFSPQYVAYSADADLLAPGGGIRSYTNFDGTVPEFASNTRMLVETNSGGTITGFRLLHPTGAVDVYEEDIVFAPGSSPANAFFLTQQIDERGNATTFVYTTNNNKVLLEYVIDGDGKTNTLAYTNITFEPSPGTFITYSNYVSQITDPFGRTVKFTYPGAGGAILTGPPSANYTGLTNIVDVAGLSSSFSYADVFGKLSQLTTPYGNTSFYFHFEPAYGINSLTLITEPNGSHQMFFYAGDANIPTSLYNSVPAVYTDPRYVPTNRPADGPDGTNHLDNPDWNNPAADDKMQFADSIYWGRQQFANLSASFLNTAPNWDLNSLTTNDFNRARLRHWNQSSSPVSGAENGQGNSLSIERDPSPDGTTIGEMTWYDYHGKTDYNVEGTSTTPTLIIKVLPDGSEAYTLNQLDQWNHPTNVISTYSVNGTVLLRTNRYVYAANGIDLLMAIGPDGVTNAAYAYDGNHQVLAMTNALGEVTQYAYNANELLTSITQPNGLVTTNIYGSDGYLAQQIVTGFSTNSYTYTNGLVWTHTDERGLTTTNTWDALNRLTKVAYPDGTSIAYTYTNLDLAKVVDRMGFTNSYGYNAVRQKVAETNALGNPTLYQYCECGALESIEDALGNFTLFTHDNQGNLTQTTYPDSYTVNNTYNLLRQLVTATDSGGMKTTNYYNNQGRLTVSSNNVGRVRSLAYDVDDRVTNSIDANGVGITTTYDNLSRQLTRSFPDDGVEKWGYTLNISGPTSYTNQIGNMMLYGYDTLNRKTNEVYVGVTTNQFAYNGAGDLLTLTDGNGNPTTWIYDTFGRVTNKVDAANNLLFVYKYDSDNRLTNRASLAKGSTAYTYDAVGNLTHVTYPVSPAISLGYDKLNRLTNMVDGVGTTAYGYDAAGQLLSEGGLWPNDTVSYTYNNHLRTGLGVQAPNADPWSESYIYDAVRRLASVTSPAGEFDYHYSLSQPSTLINQLNLPNGSFITNTFDGNARLLSTILKNSGGTNLDYQSYAYNQANQRIAETNLAGDFRNYTYDNAGELKTAIGKEPGGTTNRLQEQLGYAYDAAGNLNYRTNNALLQQFNVNSLNELTTMTNGLSLTVAGATTSAATNVTVNSLTAALYGDATFAKDGFTIASGNNTFTAIAHDGYGRWATNAVTVNLPATNSFAYDLNGNLLTNGNEVLVWNDENELVTNFVAGSWKSEFVYDGKMRRRIERDYSWSAGTSGWQLTNEVHFVYDGNVIVQQRDANNLPTLTLTRGTDLSGTFQGAGGIGGLLAMTENSLTLISQPSTSFYHCDGNGNVTILIGANQLPVAKALYDPFGNFLSLSGFKANVNPFWYSSKPIIWTSGDYDFLYRIYSPSLHRWPNRDPLGEFGYNLLTRKKPIILGRGPNLYLGHGPNLYLFVNDSPIFSFDKWGLDAATCAGCYTTFNNKMNEIAQELYECGQNVTENCDYCNYVPPYFQDKCMLICEYGGLVLCGDKAAAEEAAAAAALKGCLSGCQPPGVPCPPRPPWGGPPNVNRNAPPIAPFPPQKPPEPPPWLPPISNPYT